MGHCVVNGSRCTKCCQVLQINVHRNYLFKNNVVDGDTLRSMLIPISKRRAKIINSRMVDIAGSSVFYYKCKNLTEKGCGIYDKRPDMCSGYPDYGRERIEVKEYGGGLYHQDCTYYAQPEAR